MKKPTSSLRNWFSQSADAQVFARTTDNHKLSAVEPHGYCKYSYCYCGWWEGRSLVFGVMFSASPRDAVWSASVTALVWRLELSALRLRAPPRLASFRKSCALVAVSVWRSAPTRLWISSIFPRSLCFPSRWFVESCQRNDSSFRTQLFQASSSAYSPS